MDSVFLLQAVKKCPRSLLHNLFNVEQPTNQPDGDSHTLPLSTVFWDIKEN